MRPKIDGRIDKIANPLLLSDDTPQELKAEESNTSNPTPENHPFILCGTSKYDICGRDVFEDMKKDMKILCEISAISTLKK